MTKVTAPFVGEGGGRYRAGFAGYFKLRVVLIFRCGTCGARDRSRGHAG